MAAYFMTFVVPSEVAPVRCHVPNLGGDELTLCASAHLLPRPILVLSDQEHEHERRFEPPPLIHSSVWGPEG